MRKHFLTLALFLAGFSAQASGGSFYCSTDAGNDSFDGVVVSGTMDGEAQVTDLSVIFAEGDGDELALELLSLDLTNGFQIQSFKPSQEEQLVISIKSQKSNGTSRAIFQFREGEFVTKKYGTCKVSFKAGI